MHVSPTALAAYNRRREFNQKIVERAAALAASKEAPPAAAAIEPEAVPAEPDPPVPVFTFGPMRVTASFANFGPQPYRSADVTARRKLSMMEIKRAVCRHFGVEHSDMVSARRTKEIILPRHVAMYLCRELTPSTLPGVGRMFGERDHTTVIGACRKIAKLIEANPDLAAEVAKLRAELEALL